MRAAAAEAVQRARAGDGPTLLECKTYRHYGHSKSDPAPYRTKEELEQWFERDPLKLARARLLQDGLSEEQIAAAEQATTAQIDQAVENALAAPYPGSGPGRGHGVQRMSELEFRVAIRDALAEELERDPSVIFFGEDVAVAGGVFKATPDLLERFGPDRVFDTPISELALAGAAYGAAVTGLRPVFEVMFGDFMALAMDSLVNQAAKFWYISNEQGTVPLVVRSAVGAGGRFGAIHSQTHGTWFQGVPGLKIAFPSSPAEAKGLLKASIRDDNPVIFLEHKRLYSVKGPPPDAGAGDHPARPGGDRARGRRPDDRLGRQGRVRRAGGRRDAGRRGHLGGGRRPAHAAAAGRRHRARVGGAHQPAAGRRGGPAHRRLGGRPARRGRRGGSA